MVHIYNGILLSHKKERIWVSSNEVDEPTAYYTEWSQSEREKQVLYISAYMWNLERWYWWTYLQGSNGDADTENRLVDMVTEEKGGDEVREQHWNIYIPYVKQRASGNLLYEAGSSIWCSVSRGIWWEVGERFKREGTYVHLWVIHVNVWQKATQYCKANIL